MDGFYEIAEENLPNIKSCEKQSSLSLENTSIPSTNDLFKVPWAAPVRCATMAGQVNVNVQAINGAVLHLQEGKSCKSMVLQTG